MAKGGPLEFLKIQFVAKYQKMKEGPFGDIKKFRKKSHKAEKGGEVSYAKKLESGDPLAWQWICISC